MTYVRTDNPDFSVPLSRDELRVFTSIRGETTLADIIAKTRFDAHLVKDVVAKLIARGLIRSAGDDVRPQVDPTPQAQTDAAWLGRRKEVETFLISRVGGNKAKTYIAQLRNCADEQTFTETTRSIAQRLSLIVDAGVGEALLTVLGRH